jgi:hypothetical protein
LSSYFRQIVLLNKNKIFGEYQANYLSYLSDANSTDEVDDPGGESCAEHRVAGEPVALFHGVVSGSQSIGVTFLKF